MFRLQREELRSKIDWLSLSSTYMCRLTKIGDELKIQTSWSPSSKGMPSDISSFSQVIFKVDGGDDFDLEVDIEKLKGVVKSCIDNDVIIKTGAKSIGFQSGRHKYSIKAEAPCIEDRHSFLDEDTVLDITEFRDSLLKSISCAGVNDVRHYLNGVHLRKMASGLALESSNGHMGSIIDVFCHPDAAWPDSSIMATHNATKLAKALSILLRLGYSDFNFFFNSTMLQARWGDYSLAMFSLQGNFPALQKQFEGDFNIKLRFHAQDLIDALSGASSINESVILDANAADQEMRILSEQDDNEYFDCDIQCSTNKDIKISFNNSYLSTVIGNIKQDIIEFDIIDYQNRVKIHGNESEGEDYILMPMRL